MKVFPKSYHAPFWAINAHVETVVPALFKKAPKLKLKTKAFQFPDGDITLSHWKQEGSNQLSIIVPGLESDSSRNYVRSMGYYLSKIGDIVILDHRNCGIPNKLFRSYHSGNSEDLHFFISQVAHEYEQINLVAFSLGGNIALKHLGEQGSQSVLHKAAVISAPFDLNYCSNAIEKPSNGIYQKRFVKKLQEKLLKKSQDYPNLLDPNEIKASKTLRAIDNIYTAPAHGFKDASEYYQLCSSKEFISQIEVPTLLINALNDPITPIEDVHEIERIKSDSIKMLYTKKGGHVGHPSVFLNGMNWYEQVVLQYLSAS